LKILEKGDAMKLVFGICLAATIAAAAFAGGSVHAQDRAIQLAAAGGCMSKYNTCVMRCRRDVPQDRNCPSDHCSPKLSTCKATGCWQEGRRYGGQKSCGLK